MFCVAQLYNLIGVRMWPDVVACKLFFAASLFTVPPIPSITRWLTMGCGKEMPLSFQPIICFTMAQITKILQIFVLWGSSVTDKDNFTDTWTENFHIWCYSSLKSVNSCSVMLHVVTYHKHCEFQGCVNQSACLSKLKERMPPDECVVLMDFSENYSFVIQEAAQGFHWDSSQTTVHPFVICFRNMDNSLTVQKLQEF